MEFQGEDKLREWLLANGFRCSEDYLRSSENQCNWYAYRHGKYLARRCECNDDKPGMQIVVRPHSMNIHRHVSRSAEIELRGEAAGEWWHLSSYSLTPDDVPGKLDDIEKRLISAWNALMPDDKRQPVAQGKEAE